MMAAGKEKNSGPKGELMNVKKISEEENNVVLLATGTHPEFINGIRRIMMNTVTTVAIEDVHFYNNTSVLFDEYIASRLGYIALKLKKSLKKGEVIKLTLHEKGPKTVTGADIDAKHPDIEVVNKDIPIVKLKENQELKIEMEAVMNSGNVHTKWQPAIMGYNEVPELKNHGEKIKNAQKLADNCPVKALEVKAGKVVLKDPYNCTLCGYCEDKSNDQLELVTSNSSFVLRVESHGQKKPKEVLIEAADMLKVKSSDFQSALSSIKK